MDCSEFNFKVNCVRFCVFIYNLHMVVKATGSQLLRRMLRNCIIVVLRSRVPPSAFCYLLFQKMGGVLCTLNKIPSCPEQTTFCLFFS